jgi:adenine/guanine phosphoribosyltransferase-like PRPP-binding protein
VERAGAAPLGLTVVIELSFLGGRARVDAHPVHSLLIV